MLKCECHMFSCNQALVQAMASTQFQPLRWGFFGAGRVTSDFVTSISQLPKSDHLPVAIAARDLERATEFATRTKLPKAFDDYSKLAADPEIDVIYIGTVNSEHYDLIKGAISHGKHVLCEKPLCLNAWQAREVVELARRKKVFLMEGFWTRFFPAFQYFEEYLKKGTIGDINLTVSGFGHFIEDYRMSVRELGGGAMMNYGVYGVQYATRLFGKPDRIVACGHSTKTGVDTNAVITLLYNEGQKMATFIPTTKSNAPGYEVHGKNGTIKLLPHAYAPVQLETPEGTLDFELPPIEGEFTYRYAAAFGFEAEEVRQCIQNGKLESERMPLDESVLIAEITDEIRRQLGVVYPQDDNDKNNNTDKDQTVH